ncbi:amino acid permease [Arcanobacterium ihumii]|uniref:amino acid permease n=1 Tax=Arcanobacterium ihumii TaxID=2138162 RepID=UPI001F2F0AEF|nr:amino acid permease [Arcanobacterium ihumii]
MQTHTHEQEHTQLERKLTSAQISMIALSGALGTGLFLGAGSTISFAGPATIISYALAGSVALSVVWALAEMVSAHPVPGGHGAIAATHLGKLGGYISRWNFAITMLTAVGAEVTAAATYFQYWFPNLNLGLGTVLCSVFIVALNLATVRLYGTSEYWFSMIKVTAIVIFIILGLAVIFTGWPSSDEPLGFANLTSDGGFAPKGVIGILLASCMAVFSFGGIENVSVSAAESEHPERDIPRAASTMIWRLLIFYILVIAVIVTLQPWTTTVAESGQADSSPFVKVLDSAGLAGAGHIMNAILIVAALSAANGCLYTGSRMIHSLALDGMAPRFAARTTQQGAPRGAVGIATLCFFIASALAIFSPNSAFMSLYGAATVGILVTWVMVMLTHIKFRQHWNTQNFARPPARLWGAPVVNIAVIIISVAIFIALRTLLPVVWTAGIPYLIILFASFFILNAVRKLPEPAPLTTRIAKED